MNLVLRSAAVALAAIATGCGGATEPEADVLVSLRTVPTEIVLRPGQEVRVQDGLLRLTFVRVLEDSRCPEDVTCVWEGNAKVQIGARVGTAPSDPIDLNTAGEPRAVEWQGLRIILEEVLPSRQGDTPPKSEDYSIRLRLERVE